MERKNEFLGIVSGILLLLGMHLIAGLAVFLVSFPIAALLKGGYAILVVWAFAAISIFLWQLLYVIPLIFWLRRRQRRAMVKGVIICAVLTALLNGGCYLLYFSSL
jgi:predicted Co/Zn/Cd cation transporter (cation efflux family)